MILLKLLRCNKRAYSTTLNTVRTSSKSIIVQAPETKITKLNSGIRIASETIPSETATV